MLQKLLLHNVPVGHRNFQGGDFLLCKEPKFPGFRTDPHFWFRPQFQTVDYNHHPPNAPIPECGDAAGIIIDRQFLKSLFGNPKPQFLIGFPDDGLESGFCFLTASADEAPGI